ncbi:MAG TPA: GNAT family N-acetyltransferase [Mariprofundaceae bacterium]|nr:GNAT family N-acetyltransferase [Mariprofundaceae bacterium]
MNGPALHCDPVHAIGDVPAREWDVLAAGQPFLRHAFLHALEASGCVAAATGWTPMHLVCRHGNAVVGALPLYLKSHSFGEFVFDWAWAEAYARAGIDYYPKLVSAVPYTPATGPRLLVHPDADADAVSGQLISAAIRLCETLGVSSLHVLFPTPEETERWRQAGLLQRHDCQFHWHNNGYRDFDDFLAGFSAKRRKEARRERRIAREQVAIRMLSGDETTPAHWNAMFALYRRHMHYKGSPVYLNRECFQMWASGMADAFRLCLAERDGRVIAGALLVQGADTLYGRYWGSFEELPCLHFELCYYAPIEYCITHRLARFEAGAQGEHKLGRGLAPVTTQSVHWIAHPVFRRAIGDYLERERQGIEHYMHEAERLTPFRRGG